METPPIHPSTTPSQASPVPHNRETHWMQFLTFGFFTLLYGLLHYAMQAYVYSVDQGVWILVRAASFTGATLIGCALLSSVIFRLFPRTAQYWRVRRYFGVWGVVYVYLHMLLVYQYFHFDFAQIYSTLNPLNNPIVFGAIALPIFTAMALTSNDHMMDWLTPRRWKFLHRFVYVAYLASVFHFVSINPAALVSIPGALLLIITVLTIIGHTYLFFRTAIRKRFRSIGSVVGLVIIITAIVVGWTLYQNSVGLFLQSLM